MPKAVAVLCALLILAGSPLRAAGEQSTYPFSLETRKEAGSHRVVAHNRGAAAVSVRVSLTDSRNAATDRLFPFFAVIPAGSSELPLARIRPATIGAGYSFRTRSSWTLGDYHARQSADARYRLPYGDGLAFPIVQAAGGPLSSHHTRDSEYAVDIAMPEGTPVVAARDGIVVYTEAAQTYGGRHPDLLGRANAVRIQHDDGTIALYAHLAHAGVSVFPGQRVAAGTPIGRSGSTGYSSGPHLHFAVQTVLREGDSLTTVALPFRFSVGKPPVSFAPRYGMVIEADYSSPGRVPGVIAAGAKSRPRSTPVAGTPR